MNESCHIWMSHVTYKRVTSHINQSCHTWMRCLPQQTARRCRFLGAHHKQYTFICGMTHSYVTWLIHGPVISYTSRCTSQGMITYESVMSHVCESCHTRISHVTYKQTTKLQPRSWRCRFLGAHHTQLSHMNQSCHIWSSHGPTHKRDMSHMIEYGHTYEQVTCTSAKSIALPFPWCTSQSIIRILSTSG